MVNIIFKNSIEKNHRFSEFPNNFSKETSNEVIVILINFRTSKNPKLIV